MKTAEWNITMKTASYKKGLRLRREIINSNVQRPQELAKQKVRNYDEM